MRINKISFWALVTFFTACVFFWSNMAAAERTALPNINLTTVSGQKLTNKVFYGHVSLLHVWGTWCHYCREEQPALLQLKSHGIPIYGIALKDDANSVREYLGSHGNPYVMVGMDYNGAVSNALGIFGTPETYVIDKHGMIRETYTGGVDPSEVISAVQRISKEG